MNEDDKSLLIGGGLVAAVIMFIAGFTCVTVMNVQDNNNQTRRQEVKSCETIEDEANRTLCIVES